MSTMSCDGGGSRSTRPWDRKTTSILYVTASCCGYLDTAIAVFLVYLLTNTDVDSRNGSLYCQICDDFVWDPTFEELRVRKIGTGTFSSTFVLS